MPRFGLNGKRDRDIPNFMLSVGELPKKPWQFKAFLSTALARFLLHSSPNQEFTEEIAMGFRKIVFVVGVLVSVLLANAVDVNAAAKDRWFNVGINDRADLGFASGNGFKGAEKPYRLLVGSYAFFRRATQVQLVSGIFSSKLLLKFPRDAESKLKPFQDKDDRVRFGSNVLVIYGRTRLERERLRQLQREFFERELRSPSQDFLEAYSKMTFRAIDIDRPESQFDAMVAHPRQYSVGEADVELDYANAANLVAAIPVRVGEGGALSIADLPLEFGLNVSLIGVLQGKLSAIWQQRHKAWEDKTYRR